MPSEDLTILQGRPFDSDSTQLLFVESGGDNLAANYSRELADYIIYVIDVGKLESGSCGSILILL